MTDHSKAVRRYFLVTILMFVALISVATAAAPKLQVFFASDFTDQPYQQKTYENVAGKWKMPASLPEPGNKAVVIVSILKDGTASDGVLHHESGSEAWDAAAIAAVEKARPFDPLPKSYGRESVEVHFHFEYAK